MHRAETNDEVIVSASDTPEDLIEMLIYALKSMTRGSTTALRYVLPDLVEAAELVVPAAEYVESRG